MLIFKSIIPFIITILLFSGFAFACWNGTILYSNPEVGGINLAFAPPLGPYYTNSVVNFTVDFWGSDFGTCGYKFVKLVYDGTPLINGSIPVSGLFSFGIQNPTIGIHTIYVYGEDLYGSCAGTPFYEGEDIYCENTKYSYIIGFTVYSTSSNATLNISQIDPFTLSLDKNQGTNYDMFTYHVSALTGSTGPYDIKIEYYDPYTNGRHQLAHGLVASGSWTGEFSGSTLPTTTDNRQYGLIATVTTQTGASRQYGSYYMPFLVPLTIVQGSDNSLVGGFMNDTDPFNVPIDRVKLTYVNAGLTTPYNLTFFGCVGTLCNKQHEYPICTFVNVYDTQKTITFYPKVGSFYWGWYGYDDTTAIARVQNNQEVIQDIDLFINNQSHSNFYAIDCLSQGGVIGQHIDAWGTLGVYNTTIQDYNTNRLLYCNATGDCTLTPYTPPSSSSSSSGGVVPTTIPTIDAGNIINIIFNPKIICALVLVGLGIFAEAKAGKNSGGRIFALILFLGLTILSLPNSITGFQVYPTWVLIIEILIGGLIVAKLGSNVFTGGK